MVAPPLARRPYDLRHAAVSTWLNAGVEAPQVAAWAEHNVAVLLRVYARCLDGGEQEARERVRRALGLEGRASKIDPVIVSSRRRWWWLEAASGGDARQLVSLVRVDRCKSRIGRKLPMYSKMVRKTHSLVQVAMALMEDPTGRHWGYDLSKRSGVRSGVLYPMLSRMLDERWVIDGWEDPISIEDRRPPRRYYELTDHGRLNLGAILQEARNDARFRDILPKYAS